MKLVLKHNGLPLLAACHHRTFNKSKGPLDEDNKWWFGSCVTFPCKIKAIKGIISRRYLLVPLHKQPSSTQFSQVNGWWRWLHRRKWDRNRPDGPDWYFSYVPGMKICTHEIKLWIKYRDWLVSFIHQVKHIKLTYLHKDNSCRHMATHMMEKWILLAGYQGRPYKGVDIWGGLNGKSLGGRKFLVLKYPDKIPKQREFVMEARKYMAYCGMAKFSVRMQGEWWDGEC